MIRRHCNHIPRPGNQRTARPQRFWSPGCRRRQHESRSALSGASAVGPAKDRRGTHCSHDRVASRASSSKAAPKHPRSRKQYIRGRPHPLAKVRRRDHPRAFLRAHLALRHQRIARLQRYKLDTAGTALTQTSTSRSLSCRLRSERRWNQILSEPTSTALNCLLRGPSTIRALCLIRRAPAEKGASFLRRSRLLARPSPAPL